MKAADLLSTVRGIVGDDRSFVIILRNPDDGLPGVVVDMASSAIDENEVDEMIKAAIDPESIQVPFGALTPQG